MRILLAEPPGVFRDSIRRLLTAELDRVDGAGPAIAEASTGEQARRAAAALQPQIALVSSALPPDGGFCATEAIAAAAPACRIVLLAERPEQVLLLRAVRAGATGFVARVAPLSQFVAAVLAASRREAYIPPTMLESLLRRSVGLPSEMDGPAARVERLTMRERQVLMALASGVGNRIVGQRLGISPHTARTHVQNLLPKLGVHSRLEAAAIARSSGLLDAVDEDASA